MLHSRCYKVFFFLSTFSYLTRSVFQIKINTNICYLLVLYISVNIVDEHIYCIVLRTIEQYWVMQNFGYNARKKFISFVYVARIFEILFYFISHFIHSFYLNFTWLALQGGLYLSV